MDYLQFRNWVKKHKFKKVDRVDGYYNKTDYGLSFKFDNNNNLVTENFILKNYHMYTLDEEQKMIYTKTIAWFFY